MSDKPLPFQVDTSRIKSLTTGKVDADTLSFGPPKAGGPSWGRGSQTKGPSRTEGSTKMSPTVKDPVNAVANELQQAKIFGGAKPIDRNLHILNII